MTRRERHRPDTYMHTLYNCYTQMHKQAVIQTDRHTSHAGVACIIDLITGFGIDYHVMSNFCHKCATTGETMKESGPDAHSMWYNEHREHCQKNFEGNPDMMKVEGIMVLWGCSVEKHRMIYTTMLSDGKSKFDTELSSNQPYGALCPVY